MGLFGKKKEEEIEDEDILDEEESEKKSLKIRDLKPENKKLRKEPPKPWGMLERLIVLFTLLGTVGASGLLAISARDWKLPNLPAVKLPKLNNDEPIVITGKAEDKEKADRAMASFKDITSSLSGNYALYVVRLNNGYSYGVNEKDTMQAASLIKLPVMATLYKEAQKGAIDLETKYSLKNTDKVAGSGSLFGKPSGTVLTYRDLARYMGKESDNTAYRILKRILGEEKINATMKEIGMTGTNLTQNETTPYDIGLFFNRLWQGKILNTKNRDEILGFLTDTIYENWLVKGIPTEIEVAHKYGREVHVVNDAGIVKASNPFVIVIMTQGVVEKDADEVFPILAKSIYEIEN